MKLGALEAGGTKMVCAIGDESGKIIKRISIPTKTPEETMPEMIAFFKENEICRLGVGCFGPLDLRRGIITTTTKRPWKNYPIRDEFHSALQVPVALDTDVNAAMLGEATYGSARGLDSCIYITIGTGIGMGILSDGRLVHGMMHPEAGHMLIARDFADDMKSNCPYHEHCLEGLAAGPALEKRLGCKAYEVSQDHPIWILEAYYISQALVNLILTLSPQRIILGGGVMKQKQLYAMVREQTSKLLGGYVKTEELMNLESYIVAPSLADNQGVMGALRLNLL